MFSQTEQPDLAVTLLISIWELMVTNLGRNIHYHDRDYLWFPSVPAGKSRESTSIMLRPVLSKIFTKLLFMCHPAILRCVV
jgi:hypothetical protein